LDDGWLRLLDAGGPARFQRSQQEWNAVAGVCDLAPASPRTTEIVRTT
jgi:hypothetical protein